MKLSKSLLLFFVISIIHFNGRCQTASKKEKLLGVITKNELQTSPYSSWFNTQFESYTVQKKLKNQLKKSLQNYHITVFMGTWCGDSRKEVPRFYKVLEEINYPIENLKIIAVNNTKEAYKKSPTNEEVGLNIHRVPTFIFYKNGKEVNRIIEHPITSFEEDIIEICNATTYRPNYSTVEVLQKELDEKGSDYIKTSNTLMNNLREVVKSDYGFGYFLLNNKEHEKAIAVFTLNTKLFSKSPNTFDSLAEAYEVTGNTKLAIENYSYALSLIEENSSVLRLKNKISALKMKE